jgi:hypothetical protein
VVKFRQNRFRQEVKCYFLRSTNSLILFGIRRNSLISGRSLLLYQFTKRVTKLTVIIVVGCHCYSYQHHTKFYRISSSRLSPYVDEIIGNQQCGFRRSRSTTDQIFCIRQTLEIKWEYNDTVQQLFTDFKRAYDSMRREVWYNILIVWGTHETSQVD